MTSNSQPTARTNLKQFLTDLNEMEGDLEVILSHGEVWDLITALHIVSAHPTIRGSDSDQVRVRETRDNLITLLADSIPGLGTMIDQQLAELGSEPVMLYQAGGQTGALSALGLILVYTLERLAIEQTDGLEPAAAWTAILTGWMREGVESLTMDDPGARLQTVRAIFNAAAQVYAEYQGLFAIDPSLPHP